MIESSTLIDDIKGEFEGGTSLSVDWDTVIRKGVENVLDNCRPETLKRRVPIYGGLATDLTLYYCPPDVLVPSDLYTHDRQSKFTYVPPKMFYGQNKSNVYTIEYVNGARFLVVRHSVNEGSLTVSEMDEVGTKTGGSPALNEHNELLGSACVEATFTDAGVEFGDTITAIDITDYLKGVLILPVYIPNADNLVSLQLRLKTTDSDYYKVISTADSIGDYFVDGLNMVKFDMASKTSVGSPVATGIVEWSIIGTTATGTTATLIFGKLTLQQFAPYFLQYYTNRAYVDGVTGAKWKETIENAQNDKINFDRDTAGILHYECCLLVTQMATFDNIDSQATKRFQGQLQRKYANYYATHPSDEAPLSYSKSPEIDMSQDIDYGRTQDQITDNLFG